MASDTESTSRRIWLGTWPLSAAIAIVISIVTSILMSWAIGSPQLLVITIASFLTAALSISVLRSRGRFRLHAILVLMTFVGVGSATVGRKIVFVEKHRALVRQVVERNGNVTVRGASRQEQDGWRMIQGGYVIPSWLHPLYDYFANVRVVRMSIPADMLTLANLELLPIEDKIRDSTIVLEGAQRDSDALLKFSSLQRHETVSVFAKHLTEADVQYLSILKGKPLHITLESPSPEDIMRLQQIAFSGLFIDAWKNSSVDGTPFSTATNSELKQCRLTINDSILSSQFLASLKGLCSVYSLELLNSNLQPGTVDELANWTSLRYLTINGCNVSDADMVSLARNHRLESLLLCGTKITDDGLSPLTNMKGLTRVEISGSKCTWDGIRELCRNSKLESLYTDVPKPPITASRTILPLTEYSEKMIRELILEEPELTQAASDN